MDSGSAIPSTDRYTMYAITVDVPPMKDQLRIVELLNPIEGKIELNQKISEKLYMIRDTLVTELMADKIDGF